MGTREAWIMSITSIGAVPSIYIYFVVVVVVVLVTQESRISSPG